MEKVKHSRQVLRAKKVYVEGQKKSPMRYIDECAVKMPVILAGDEPINHVARMRKLYLTFGLKGLNVYVDYVNIRTRYEHKRITRIKRRSVAGATGTV